MFDDVLIESAGKDRQKGGWVTALISMIVHLAVIGGLVAAGYYVKENPEIIEKPMSAFIVASAPPPPPPPPPPASRSSGQTTPRCTIMEIRAVTHPPFCLSFPADSISTSSNIVSSLWVQKNGLC